MHLCKTCSCVIDRLTSDNIVRFCRTVRITLSITIIASLNVIHFLDLLKFGVSFVIESKDTMTLDDAIRGSISD